MRRSDPRPCGRALPMGFSSVERTLGTARSCTAARIAPRGTPSEPLSRPSRPTLTRPGDGCALVDEGKSSDGRDDPIEEIVRSRRRPPPPNAGRRLEAPTRRGFKALPAVKRSLNRDVFRAPAVSLLTISSTLDSLFKVLCIFPSRYLFAIGLSPVFSFGWNLPPV